ncbi:cell division protein ZapA [Pseudorhodoplanes sinuspersici]|uniref:Cell division protein ZapA n=1 Tax=Pseudorhodoplanes sinuspersici TaxID=1235591 RepID=A0A1W6ZNK3_9HYPH|nr:cell division protein ZapA [Pseudorhodoplanes sinuspersici]ARP98364.1 cell division protein ZapA [Pseudorhodoplanes sinuspersici]RKE66027.1 cell division protein ZapA [Pseudorhodoplanes sinuspersici]
MAQVNVTINGRQYRMGCEDGQEEHVMTLAQEIDDRIEQLRGAHGEIGDQRLTVMAALTVADELAESAQRIRRLEEEIAGLQDARVISADRAQQAQAAIVTALNTAAERIEEITRQINQSVNNGPGVALG